MHVAIHADASKLDAHPLNAINDDSKSPSPPLPAVTPVATPAVTLPTIKPSTTSPPPPVNGNETPPGKREVMPSPLATGTFVASEKGTIQSVRETAYGIRSSKPSPVTKVSSSPPKVIATPVTVPSIPNTPKPDATLPNVPTLAAVNSAMSIKLPSVPNNAIPTPMPSLQRQPSEASKAIMQSMAGMATMHRSPSELSSHFHGQPQVQPAPRTMPRAAVPPPTTTTTTTSSALQRNVSTVTTVPSGYYPTYNVSVPAAPRQPIVQRTYPQSYGYATPMSYSRTPYAQTHTVTRQPPKTAYAPQKSVYSQQASILSRNYGVPNQFTNRWAPTAQTPTPGPQPMGSTMYGGYGQQRGAPYVASNAVRSQKQTSYQNANQWPNNGNGSIGQQNGRPLAPNQAHWGQSNGGQQSNVPSNGQWNANQPNGSWPGRGAGNGGNNSWNGGNGGNAGNGGGNGSYNGPRNGGNGPRDGPRDNYGGPARQLRAQTPSRSSRSRDPNVCTWYGTASGCQWGESCFKSHDDPNSRDLCPNVNAPWGCKWGDQCWFRHETYSNPADAGYRRRRRNSNNYGGGGGYNYNDGSRVRSEDSSSSSDFEASTASSFDREHNPTTPRSPRRMVESAQSPHSLSSQKSVINVNDLLIQFENAEDKCTLNCDGGGCSHLDRMILTLRYYSKWNVVSDLDDKRQFMEFVKEIYVTLLNDYVHIMKAHKDDTEWERELDAIHNDDKWAKDFSSYKPCLLRNSNCLLLDAHRQDREEEKAESEQLETRNLVFYRDLMDSMHCYLVHRHDNGFRIRVTQHSKRAKPKHKKWTDSSFRFDFKCVCNLHDVFVFKTQSCVSRGGR